MPSFRNIIADKKYAKKGEATPVKKIGGLTIDFSAQSFSQEYLDSFLEHIEQEKRGWALTPARTFFLV